MLVTASAWARVGVASVTDGEPLGQSPSETDRVLRVGIDMQANERVSTQTNDRAHLVFLDGTSLTIGPDSVVVLDKYVYDADRKQGEMTLNATRGVFRFVGGAISKSTEVTIKTPSATIGVRGGIVAFTVNETGTMANFLNGDAMRVTSRGSTQTATRNGSQIAVPAGGFARPPNVVGAGGLPGNQPLEHSAAMAVQQRNQMALSQTILQNATASSNDPTPTARAPSSNDTSNTSSGSGTPSTASSIDEALKQSDLGKHNSHLTPSEARIAYKFQPRAGNGRPSRAKRHCRRTRRCSGRRRS
jgi:hypothetical protein